MEASFAGIEKAYQKEIALLQELLECLSLEKDHLVNLNLESLWAIMEEKQNVLKSIEQARDEIQSLVKDREQGQVHSPEVKSLMTVFSRKIERLKKEIGARVRENVSFIQDTLGFLNEMISIFVAGAQPEPAYGPVRKAPTESANLIYHREV